MFAHNFTSFLGHNQRTKNVCNYVVPSKMRWNFLTNFAISILILQTHFPPNTFHHILFSFNPSTNAKKVTQHRWDQLLLRYQEMRGRRSCAKRNLLWRRRGSVDARRFLISSGCLRLVVDGEGAVLRRQFKMVQRMNSSACYVLLVVCVNAAFAQFGRPQTVSALEKKRHTSYMLLLESTAFDKKCDGGDNLTQLRGLRAGFWETVQ